MAYKQAKMDVDPPHWLEMQADLKRYLESHDDPKPWFEEALKRYDGASLSRLAYYLGMEEV